MAYVLGLGETVPAQLALVGGKAANLGELARIAGIQVPDGFCVTTEAFTRVLAETPPVGGLLKQLARVTVAEREQIAVLSAELRGVIAAAAIPPDISAEIVRRLADLGEDVPCAVRSSATAEDLPGASFAGQQDTFLNVIGPEAVLQHVSLCWASLFTERAVTYRLQNGFDHRQVRLAVVVQRMVFPQAAGVMFTADPVTGNRKVASIDAAFGLGEAVVAGRVDADNYRVRDGAVIARWIGAKRLAVVAVSGGGTQEQALTPEQGNRPVLTGEQIAALAATGRRIERHFGRPQDIEWCLAGEAFYVVQSRPITTLFPIPERDDQEYHVYVSVGHQQMMTDPIRPLGLAVWQLTAGRPMFTAGGRLFVDVAPDLASPARRDMLVNGLGKADPLIRDALLAVLARGELAAALPKEQDAAQGKQAPPPHTYQTLSDIDPAVVGELIRESEAEIARLGQDIRTKAGPELLDFIREDIGRLRKNISDPRSFGVLMTAMNAAGWLNEKLKEWLGETNAADTLTQSAPNNVTAEMGLALLDVADALRPYPQAVEYLRAHAGDDGFLAGLGAVEGGREAGEALGGFLDRYGMRCPGEIDITRTRWRENPAALIPLILSNMRTFAPGESRRRFERGRQDALRKEEELLRRLRALPDGEQRARETKRMIELVRNLMGYREYPKYTIVSRYLIYKQALLREAARLVAAGVIREPGDIYYLTLEELREVVRTGRADRGLIDERKAGYAHYARLTPPRVMTSDGEIFTGAYRREDLPPGALPGLAVSAGVVEGRARVILDMADARVSEGEVLVTPFTDPSWTPLFVAVKGLVTEVGGLMTHGAVIAREYGLPAVVGVENATRRIRDGQRIRVNGTDGYVEILE